MSQNAPIESGNSLFLFGRGYIARRLTAERNGPGQFGDGDGYRVIGATYRDGGTPRANGDMPIGSGEAILSALSEATHILISTPPVQGRDPVLSAVDHRKLAQLPKLRWIGYLSSTGVYGDYQGDWVDETSPLRATRARSADRMNAEAEWLKCSAAGLPVSVFRLSGIYGPGRSAFDALRKGRARRIDKPGQVFSRCHVDDICAVLRRSMAGSGSGGIYNVADNQPAPQHEVVAHAARMIGVAAPPLIPIDEADLSPAAREFYASCRRVRNDRIKKDLGVALACPTFADGLQAIADEEGLLEA